MKILFVIDMFIDGGASITMIGLIEGLKAKGVETKIFTRDNYSSYNNVEVCVGDGSQMIDYIKKNNFDLIHWFRTNFSILSHSYFDACDKLEFQSPFVFVTLCQVPNKDFLLRLTLKELQNFDYFIFICKEAYNHKYHKIIPDEKKTMIYFGTHHIQNIQPKTDYDKKQLIFGRGSTLNKCPDDMIENYFKISRNQDCKFRIAGYGDNTKILEKVIKYKLEDEVEMFPHLSHEEWLLFLRGLDIYLYQLPLDSYSAIDGTIQDAMLTGIPVVLMGPPAPKELIVNGESGYAASSVKEFVDYAVMLTKDANLRKQIGQNGRTQILNNFSHAGTIQNYYKLYNTRFDKLSKGMRIPFVYSVKYARDYLMEKLTEKVNIVLGRL